MGEARRRGSYEERKAQAIEAGRIKGASTFKRKLSKGIGNIVPYLNPEILTNMLRAMGVNIPGARRRGR